MPTSGREDGSPRSFGRVRLALIAFVSAVVVAGLLAGAATGLFAGWGRSLLYATGVYTDGGASTVPPGFFDSPLPTTTTTPRGAESPVLPPLPAGSAPGRTALESQIAALPTEGIGTPAWAVAVGGTGKTVASSRSTTGVIPASSLKLLTSLAALDAFGPEHRFTTSVVTGDGAGRIVLVGGGDPYLAAKPDPDRYPVRADLDTLADQVATALTEDGRTSVSVDWDASLFSGPDWNPTWPENYRDQTTPTSALWVGEGRLSGGSPGPRSQTPARDAAVVFVAALKKHRITATLGESADAGAKATRLGAVRSMPLDRIVDEVLLHSDNDGAEVLFRQLAVAVDRPGSIVEARKALQARLTKLDAWADGTVVHDGSGLSRSDRVPPQTFVGVLDLALSDDHPELRSLAVGLPVAGSDGSLRYRFFASGTAAARGDVHAKTGTLRGVHALVGYGTTADGAVVTFAFVVNDATNDYAARNWLDRAAAVVAGCGC